MVRPFSLALRLFVAMIAGHILVEVFGNFIVSGINSGYGDRLGFVSALSFVFVMGVNALELLVCAHPGLCVRAARFALHQRRGASALRSLTHSIDLPREL